jgi:hypothetical protein
MEKENVIQKIQKLLKLQYGAESIGSTGEAFQAAKMVKKLLMEYNLSMSDIDTSDGEQKLTMTKSDELAGSDRYGNHWKFQLLGVIASNNLCSAYKRVSGKMFVIGTEDNVAIVQEFYNYLVKVFRRLAKEHWERKCKEWEQQGYNVEYILFADNTVMNKFFRSYLEGVPVGLQENYDSLKPTSAETALVVCHQEAIDEYVKENFTMNDKKPRIRTRKIYGDAYNLGAADGRAVSLNRQIAQTPKEGNLFQNI